jgi:DNA replication initiation complex subunit (GINS family)
MTATIALRERAHWLRYVDNVGGDFARKVREYIAELDLVINQSTKEKSPARKDPTRGEL